MTQPVLINLLISALGSLCLAFLILYTVSFILIKREDRQRLSLQESNADIVFLFDNEVLVNASASARDLLASAVDVGTDWSRLLSLVISRFPDLPEKCARLAECGTMSVPSQDGRAVFQCDWCGGLSKLTLFDRLSEQNLIEMDYLSFLALENELEALRDVAEHLPFPAWRENQDGAILWTNSAYLDIAERDTPPENVGGWPPKRIFKTDDLSEAPPNQARRICATGGSEDFPKYFDVFRFPMGDDTLYAASCSDAIVHAETRLRDFRQSMIEIFSQLPTGLATFDASLHLVLFNSALSDMTHLSSDFLIKRPDIFAFFDALRDNAMIPEPRNYAEWRSRVTDIDTLASSGPFSETWSLADGKTYRITGHPHHSGIFSFLIDDISDEMAFNRQLQSQIDTGQAILDSFSNAIVVFHRSGQIQACNTAYRALWDLDEEDHAQTLDDAARIWRAKCAPTTIWTEIRSSIETRPQRHNRVHKARLWDGRTLVCHVTSLPHENTLVTFETKQASTIMTPRLVPQSSKPGAIQA